MTGSHSYESNIFFTLRAEFFFFGLPSAFLICSKAVDFFMYGLEKKKKKKRLK